MTEEGLFPHASLELLDLHQNLETAQTLAERWRVAERYLNQLGIDMPIYMFLNPRAPQETQMVFSSMPECWSAHYLSEDLAIHDPFLKTCATLRPTATGAEYLEQNLHMLTEAEQNFINQAAEAGLRSGISSTLKRINPGAFGGWNFGSSLRRAEFEKLMREVQPNLHLAGMIMHQYFLEAQSAEAQTPAQIPILSPREREALLFLGQGLRIAEIAFRMGIRKVTVDLHLKTARQKLGAATREEALAKAISTGEITF